MLKLKHYRETNLYSIRKLSLVTGISRTYLKQVEEGTKIPTVKIVCVLCKTFNITPNDLIEEKYYK